MKFISGLSQKNNTIEKRVKNNYENKIQSLNINIKGVKSFWYCRRGGALFYASGPKM